MGLDVYLIEAEAATQEKAREAAWEALWARKEAGELTEEQYEKEIAALPSFSGRAESASEKHPDNVNNRRYLRSSYNGSGFNRAVPQLLAGTGFDGEGSYYWIFEPLGRDLQSYDHELLDLDVPRLGRCAERALSVAAALRALNPALRVTDVGDRPAEFTEDQALAWARKNYDAEPGPFGDAGFSSLEGHWFGKSGLTVYAAVPGKNILGRPCTWLVYDGSESVAYYADSAEVVAEFCDEAITLIERDGSASMAWSG